MGCAPSRPSTFTQYPSHSHSPDPTRRPKSTKTHGPQRQDLGYEKLTTRGKGGVKSSRMNRVKVDENGVVWYY